MGTLYNRLRMKKGRILAASIPLLVSGAALAGNEADALVEIEPAPEVGGIDIAQYINASQLKATYIWPMDFDRGPGDVSAFSTEVGTFLGAPLKFGEKLTFVSYFNYAATELDIDGYPLGVGPGAGRYDLLHRFSLMTALVYNQPGSRWYHGLYVEPSLRTDFEHVDGDDFFLSFAIASAYQVSDDLVIGAGVYGSDLLHDPWFIAGPGFVWTPGDDWFISYYGPRFVTKRLINDRNELAFEVANTGSYWNVDTFNASTKLDLRSWRAGLLYRYRLAGELWLELGAGYTLGNKLSLSTPGGLGLFESTLGQLDPSPYAFLGLTMKRW